MDPLDSSPSKPLVALDINEVRRIPIKINMAPNIIPQIARIRPHCTEDPRVDAVWPSIERPKRGVFD
jgi:hypothetical protein